MLTHVNQRASIFLLNVHTNKTNGQESVYPNNLTCWRGGNPSIPTPNREPRNAPLLQSSRVKWVTVEESDIGPDPSRNESSSATKAKGYICSRNHLMS